MGAMEMISIENNLLEVKILPAFGGKITSIRSKRSGEEFILPPLVGYDHASTRGGFDQSDGGGFDECLPSVANCEAISGEAAVPDHGDLWRVGWQVDLEDRGLVLHGDSTSRPLRLTRRAELVGSSLVLNYTLFNASDSSVTWLWSAHPLLRVEEGDLIVLPDEIKRVSVEYCSTGQFRKHSCIEWPIAQTLSGSTVDLSRVKAIDGVTAFKLFAPMGQAGWASLYRQRTGQGLVFRFDPLELPFLGLWICSGAWPERSGTKQYTVALEPTTADFDSLAEAHRSGRTHSLGGRESRRWELEVQLLGASSSVSAEEFGKLCVG